MSTLPPFEVLTVVIADQPIGVVQVRIRSPIKIFGHFSPNAYFAPYRGVFESAMELSRQFDSIPSSQGVDYALWDRLMEAYGQINRLKPMLIEVPSPIEEFAIHADWSVEITFHRL
jgi:hypothetical protein